MEHSIETRGDTGPKYDTSRYDTAMTILQLIGGKEFILVTGSRAVYCEGFLRVHLMENESGANLLDIRPDSYKTCAMLFRRFRKEKISVRQDRAWTLTREPGCNREIKRLDRVAKEKLQDAFEMVTGVYTSLYPRDEL